jgi:alpha-galactosidase
MLNFLTGFVDCWLTLASFDIQDTNVQTLRLRFNDKRYPLTVDLYYRIHEAEDLIERWVKVTNSGLEPVTLLRLFSACWNLPPGDHYRLSHLTGRWNDEFHLHREKLTPGLKVLESRRLTTSHHHNPWFAIDEATPRKRKEKCGLGF